MPEVEDWTLLKTVFADALELPPDQRVQYLDRVCLLNPELRADVEALLRSHREGQGHFRNLALELGSPVSDGPCFEPGEWVADRFQIVRFISSGGMGEVFEAEDKELNDRVALKTLRAGRISMDSVNGFRQEVKLARKINSDYVCRVYDVAKHKRAAGPDVLLLSMELIRGGTLASEIRQRGRIPEREASVWAQQLAAGLAAAHRLNILHCDLKSTNVMLAPSPGSIPRAVIMDFGLSRAIHTDAGQTPLRAGTPAFMSPEQLKGEGATVATDVYALGVVIYEMITGGLPYADTGSLAELAKRKAAPPRSPSSIVPLVQGHWDSVVLRCLHSDPKRRFQRASDVVEALMVTGIQISPGPSAVPGMARRSWFPVAGLSTLACVGVPAYFYFGFLNSGTPVFYRNSIAVIPFDAAEPDVEYISQGLTEQIADVLTNVPGLRVVSRTSAAFFKGKAGQSRQIHDQLRVGTVLSGRVRKQGSRIHISAELVDVSDGRQRWAESYETGRDDLRMIKETISRAAIYSLRFQISRAQIDSVEKRATRNAEAYNLFLLGRYYAARRTPADLKESIVCFKKAVELDPRYSAAHAALANSYHLIAPRGVLPRGEAIRKCDESAARALELDAGMGEAHLALGSNEQHYRWNWQAAEQHFRMAVASDPESALAHHWLAGLLSMLGKQDEALAEIEIARDLDPLSLAVNTAYGAFLSRARRPDAAIQQLRWVLARDATFRNAYSLLAEAYTQAKKLPDAISVAEDGVKLMNWAPHTLGTLGYCLALSGRTVEALRLAEEVKAAHALDNSSACAVAQIYLGLGDLDHTFQWLNEAARNRDPNLTILKVDPANDPLRKDARFQILLSMLHL